MRGLYGNETWTIMDEDVKSWSIPQQKEYDKLDKQYYCETWLNN